LQKVLKERGIDAMVDDARKSSSGETDAEFLKKS
jgi:TRIAP1/MDM35 family protein